METIYKLNARELTSDFVASIQNVYLERDIEITVREAGISEPWDETEYLASFPANKEHLDKAVKNVEEGKNLIFFDTIEQAVQCAEERAGR